MDEKGNIMSIIYIIPLIMVITCNLGYHLITKSIPGGMNPFVGLSATYAVALIGSILLSIVTQWTFFNQQKFTFTKYNLLL